MAEYVDLETIKSWREEVNWEVETERLDFLRRLRPLIEKWKGQLTNLWKVFRPEEIKRLISDSAKRLILARYGDRQEEYQRFMAFVIQASEISNESKLELDEVALLQRLTNSWYGSNIHIRSPWISRYLFDICVKFDANYFDEEHRLEHFHMACKFASYDVVKKFLELGQDPNLLQRETGDSPLHLLASSTHRDDETIELLLRNGADPNAVNLSGSTPLHKLCEFRSPNHINLIQRFLVVCDEVGQRVHIDARDKEGQTPLYSALDYGQKEVVKLLLRRGADPNQNHQNGTTPLHVICHCYHDDEFVRLLFEICDEMQLTVQLNTRDQWGNTPLQLAVASLSPEIVDVLLNRGADMSNCIFPTSIVTYLPKNSLLIMKMRVASGALAVAEHLEAKGYRFSRSDALTIMKFFAKHDLFEKSSDLEKSMRDDREFTKYAKQITIVPSLSLYDLIHLRSEEEEELLTYTDYFVFTDQLPSGNYKLKIPERHQENCILHLCEKLSRGFFRRWVLDPFYELIHKRLPIECCEMVLKNLNNRDLCNICLAAAVQTSS
uniref:Uncharacterized protein n=1 Tax=Trichogramma kaykai TaxID=54128 RepID=A0ABD2XKC5_9HYME